MTTRIWVAWLHHRRNVELSRALRAELHEFIWNGPLALRYAVLSWSTVRLLLHKRPRIVFAQSPSLVLVTLLAYCKRFLGFRLVVDAHNAGILPMEGKSHLLNRLAGVSVRRADLTLVTNKALLEVVQSYKGVAHVLPDPIPEFQDVRPIIRRLEGRKNVVLVCSFGADEPYEEAIQAARLLEPGTVMYITGNHSKKGLKFKDLPHNVRLTGFLAEEDYISLLLSADLVVDLTTRQDCLVCGAYEAIACGKPLVLSDTPALRAYFSRGALYTQNIATEIANAIRKALTQSQILSVQMPELKHDLKQQWSRNHAVLERLLQSWS